MCFFKYFSTNSLFHLSPSFPFSAQLRAWSAFSPVGLRLSFLKRRLQRGVLPAQSAKQLVCRVHFNLFCLLFIFYGHSHYILPLHLLTILDIFLKCPSRAYSTDMFEEYWHVSLPKKEMGLTNPLYREV